MAIINGNNSANTLNGTTSADTINAFGGNDTVRARGGNDTVDGGLGNDLLYGEDGNDLVWGRDGADRISGGRGDDRLAGGNQDDRVWGDAGNDRVWGDAGNDQVYGGAGNDQVYGGTGNDRLYDDSGIASFVDGRLFSSGNDQFFGGTGNDVFQWGKEETSILGELSSGIYGGKDIIADFLRGTDKLDLSAVVYDDEGVVEITEFAEFDTNDNGRIDGNDRGWDVEAVTLNGVTRNSLVLDANQVLTIGFSSPLDSTLTLFGVTQLTASDFV